MNISKNKQYEREFVRLMTTLGLDCHRVAGSGVASDAVCDCILLHDKKTYLVEVKATKEKKLYLRGRIKKQLQQMIEVCNRNEVIPLLAVKFKHRGWNLVVIKNLENLEFAKEGVVNEHSRTHSIITW